MGEKKRLTSSLRRALRWMLACEEHDDGWGTVGSGPSGMIDGQAQIHWRTAAALQLRGLVEAEHWLGPEEWDEDQRIRLTAAGRLEARRV